MLPRAITLSLERAEVENSVPCGRIKPRRRAIGSPRASDDLADEVPVVEEPEEEADEGFLSSGGKLKPGDGGVIGGVFLEDTLPNVDLIGVERGDGMGVVSWEAMMLV